MKQDDFLSLLIGALVIDTIIIGMNYYRVIFISDQLTRWYTTCRTSAMAMDTLIIVIYATLGMRLARFLDKNDSILIDLACIVGVQIAGDLLFYVLFQALPRGALVFDIFKDYAAEVGTHALWADALMMVGTYFVARSIAHRSMDTKLLSLIGIAYVSQYVLFLK